MQSNNRYNNNWHDWWPNINKTSLSQQHKPRVVLQSLYHNSATEPVSKELTDLKFSSQWKPEEMVQQTKEAILGNISSFQMTSIRTS